MAQEGFEKICLYFMDVSACPRVPGALGGQKRVSDALELELKTVVNCHVVTGN